MATASTALTPATDLLLGAYAMAPAPGPDEDAFYAGVADLGVVGLELPVPLAGSPSLDPAWLDRTLRPTWSLLLTCIPSVMARLGDHPGYGLAATDDDVRGLALADVARARDLATRLADEHGRRRVVAIQVHSAPGPAGGSVDAMARSLEQILAWDLAGAEVLVEHCDALVPGQPAAKGFWSLDDELAAVRLVLGTHPATAPLGLSINWGRSAIEGRSAAAATAHVRTAAASGLLRALVLSGATDVETAWGPAWGDAHIPPRGADAALAPSAPSLLGPQETEAAVRAAGDGTLLAVKVSVRPRDIPVADRLAVARAALAVADEAATAARVS